MQEPLNYRGLRRWSMLILYPVLLLSAWVAALLLTILAMPFLLGPFSATAIAGVGIVGVAAMIIPPIIGTLAGLWGVATAKRKVVKFFRGKRLPADHPLVRVTAEQAARLGMACPEVYVYEDEDINAWATGASPSNAAVGITRGALERLRPDYVYAVIGHELGHIAAADIRRMQFAISFQNALVWFFGFRSWRWRAQHLFGFVGQLGIMGMSRRREYWADAVGAVLTSADAMKGALVTIQQDGQRPSRKRKYYNQLMFSWHGGNFLASHPTMSQRCAALNEGAFEASVLRKMGATSHRKSKPRQNEAQTSRQLWSTLANRLDQWEESVAFMVGTSAVALSVLGGIGYYAWAAHHDESAGSALQQEIIVAAAPQPVPLATEAPTVPPLAFAPRVAAWSATVETLPAPVSSDDAQEFAVPGFGCFKRLNSRMPKGVQHVFDEQRYWSVYSSVTPSGVKAVREIPGALRRCLKQGGGKIDPQPSSVENRKVEVWAFANETTCWFTAAAAESSSGAATILGSCNSPED